jgi:hypothetical protein
MIEGDDTDKVTDNIDVSNRVEAEVTQRQKSRNDIGKQRAELEYQRVLRNLIADPREAIIQFDTTTVSIRKVQKPNDVKLPSWKRALSLAGMKKSSQYNKAAFPIFNINDDGIAKALQILMAEFGRGTNSSFLDDTYSIYLRDDDRAAICFKVIKKVAVIYGDPLCAGNEVGHVFEQFRSLCEQQRWNVAVVGAGPTLTTYAKTQRWRTMEFAVEQILNPMTNNVLTRHLGRQSEERTGSWSSTVSSYTAMSLAAGIQAQRERELMKVYNAWREDRHRRNIP